MKLFIVFLSVALLACVVQGAAVAKPAGLLAGVKGQAQKLANNVKPVVSNFQGALTKMTNKLETIINDNVDDVLDDLEKIMVKLQIPIEDAQVVNQVAAAVKPALANAAQAVKPAAAKPVQAAKAKVTKK